MSKILIQMISSRGTHYKIAYTIILTTILITGFIFFHPLHIEATSNAIRECQLVNPPTDSIDMNTIIFKDIAKTVHVEKEVFQCETNTGDPVIAMVSLFTELFENITTQSSLNKTIETYTCIKRYNGFISHCNSKPIPITSGFLGANCDPLNLRTLNITSPIEMETIINSKGISKTIEAEKEIFQCDLSRNKPPELLDVILFTEIFENVTTGQIIKRNIESISCLKDIQTAEVKICSKRNHL